MGKKCGAKKRQGEGTCKRPAGWGTDHVGEGACKLHGGAAPVKHGLYSKFASRRLAGRIEEMRKADGELADLADEIALARAAISTLVESDKPMGADGAETLLGLLDRLSRIAARHHKIQHGERHVLTTEDAQQFVEVVKATIRQSFDRCQSADEMIGLIGKQITDQVEGVEHE